MQTNCKDFFDIPVDHLDASAIFYQYIKELNLKEIVFACPDVGGTGRARHYAKLFQSEMVVCDKHRERANEVASMRVMGNVIGKDVVIVDDMIDTGGTMCKAADIIKEKGANSVRAVITHGILSKNSFERIRDSALEELVITDTIPKDLSAHNKIKIVSIADLFANVIKRTNEHKSISSLFI